MKIYPLEWFDSLILQTLNPKRTNIQNLSDSDLSLISENVLEESQKIQTQLKSEVFSIQKKRQIRLLVRKYHFTLIYLIDHIVENQNDVAFKTSSLKKTATVIIEILDELLSFVEDRFFNYLNLDERIPLTYLTVCQKEISSRLEKLKKEKKGRNEDYVVLQSIIVILSNSIQANNSGKITYRHIRYEKELIRGLEDLGKTKKSTGSYSTLDELLIGLNFNNSYYINHVIKHLGEKISTEILLKNRMDLLLFYYKEFSQLQSNERITFDPRRHNIKYVLENWFKHEIDYLQRKMQLCDDNKNNEITSRSEEKHELIQNKIECILSSDQIGLILRASDESRILKAKSMNQVFKTIVPHLSTSQKKELSYASMRSKSYSAEERDKEIAIKTLERIIKHIKEY